MEEESNLSRLKEIVLDEHRLVTYVTLSKELCIHVNDSKLLLDRFIKTDRIKNELNVNYIISGLTAQNKARTTVCLESEVKELCDNFETVFFKHIYSINKGIPTVDNVAFASVNKFEDLLLCSGAIKSDICVKRTSEELGGLKSSSQSMQIDVKEPSNSKVKVEKKNEPSTQKIKVEINEKKNVSETNHVNVIKTEKISPKNVNNITKQNSSKLQKGIEGFFGKNNTTVSKPKSINIKKEKEDTKDQINNNKSKEISVNIKTENNSNSLNNNKKSPEQINNNKSKEISVNIKTENNTLKKKNKSLEQIKKSSKVDKKRKRVLHISDSESEDEKENPFVEEATLTDNNMSDDEIPPTPTVNTIKITSGIINPKKRRKIVDKTYTDDDGYILTKKEEVYESCSDGEDVALNSKENINGSNPKTVTKLIETKPVKLNGTTSKKTSPKKGKQPTMMNFFKKV